MTALRRGVAACALALALCCPAGMAFAAADGSANVDSVPGDCGIPVMGTALYDNDYCEIVLGDAGVTSSVTLPNGVVVSGVSTSAADKGIRIAVIAVTPDDEPDAWAWLSVEAAGLGDGLEAYYFACYRDGVPVQPQGVVSITLASSAGYGDDAAVTYMDSLGSTARQARTVADGVVTFVLGDEGYYLITADSDGPDVPVGPDDPGDSDDPDTPVNPQPGDSGGSGGATVQPVNDGGQGAAGNSATAGGGFLKGALSQTGDATALLAFVLAVGAFGAIVVAFLARRMARK